MSLSPNFAELLWKLEVIYVSYWVGHQIVRKLHTFPQNHLARSHEHTNCSKGLCNWIMLINPLLPDQMNIFGNEFCIFPQSIFVVLNSVSFHLISKGHPYQGLECWVEAYDFFNVFFFHYFMNWPSITPSPMFCEGAENDFNILDKLCVTASWCQVGFLLFP